MQKAKYMLRYVAVAISFLTWLSGVLDGFAEDV